jgi:hypothetical protein
MRGDGISRSVGVSCRRLHVSPKLNGILKPKLAELPQLFKKGLELLLSLNVYKKKD